MGTRNPVRPIGAYRPRPGGAVLEEVVRIVQRVVSSIASTTEIVCALGCEDRLIGRSHECDDPPSVRRLPVCTEPTIDRQVKQVLREARSVYHVDADVLAWLRPDVVVTQSQCAARAGDGAAWT